MVLELKTLPKSEDYEIFVNRMLSAGLVGQLKVVSGMPIDLHQDREDLPTDISKYVRFHGTHPIVEWQGDPYGVAFVGEPFLFSEIKVEFNKEDLKPEKFVVQKLLPNLGVPLRILFWSRENHAFVCVRGDAYAA